MSTTLMDKKWYRDLVWAFSILAVIQVIIVFHPTLGFLYDLTRSREFVRFLLLFDLFTVPITVLVLSVALIERLEWKWLTIRAFVIGYVLTVLNYPLYMYLSSFLWEGVYPLRMPFVLLHEPLLAYPFMKLLGWGGQVGLFVMVYVSGLVVTPFLVGLGVSFIAYSIKKLKQ